MSAGAERLAAALKARGVDAEVRDDEPPFPGYRINVYATWPFRLPGAVGVGTRFGTTHVIAPWQLDRHDADYDAVVDQIVAMLEPYMRAALLAALEPEGALL